MGGVYALQYMDVSISFIKDLKSFTFIKRLMRVKDDIVSFFKLGLMKGLDHHSVDNLSTVFAVQAKKFYEMLNSICLINIGYVLKKIKICKYPGIRYIFSLNIENNVLKIGVKVVNQPNKIDI